MKITTPLTRWRLSRVFEAMKALGVKRGDDIIDVGTGDGFVAREIAWHFGCCVDGVDEGEEITGRDYDKALFIQAMHHMPLSVQVSRLKEALKAAKEVLIFETEPSLLGIMADKLLAKLHGGYPAPSTHRYLTEWAVIAALCKARITQVYYPRKGLYPFEHFGIKVVLGERRQWHG